MKSKIDLQALIRKPLFRFLLLFFFLYAGFYLFNLAYIGLTAPGGYYVAFLDRHLNYVRGLRSVLLGASAFILNHTGHHAITSPYELLTVGHGKIILVYSCLGFGVMSFFAAFALSWPAPFFVRSLFLLSGLLFIQALNITRFVLLSLYWNSASGIISIDHHLLFNMVLYLLLIGIIYIYIHHPKRVAHAGI